MSLVSCDTPWKPATIAMAPWAMAFSIRPGVMSMILALPCAESVITPAWEPVKDLAVWPSSAIAIASSAIEIRSPAVSSMSSSRGGGAGLTCSARSRSSSVVSPIAETTTTTSWPAVRVSTMRRATRLMPAASATDEPPYFCTTMLTGGSPAVLGEGRTERRTRRCDRWSSLPAGPAALRRHLSPSPRPRPGRRSVDFGCLFEHLGGGGDLLGLAAELHVEPVVGHDREQRVEQGAGEVAPRRDVGELPPPQGLGGVAER